MYISLGPGPLALIAALHTFRQPYGLFLVMIFSES
jgi:hypothetical protein